MEEYEVWRLTGWRQNSRPTIVLIDGLTGRIVCYTSMNKLMMDYWLLRSKSCKIIVSLSAVPDIVWRKRLQYPPKQTIIPLMNTGDGDYLHMTDLTVWWVDEMRCCGIFRVGSEGRVVHWEGSRSNINWFHIIWVTTDNSIQLPRFLEHLVLGSRCPFYQRPYICCYNKR